MTWLAFIVILVVLIIVHEFGHFIVAKLFKIRVDEFSVGFPPRLISRRFGETTYSFGALLLGGYVSIFGERAGEGKGDPRSLTSKPRLVQAAVMLAGIAFNIVFAWLLFAGGYMAGLPTAASHQGFGEVSQAEPAVLGVLPGSPAQSAGLEAEDVVRRIETGSGAATPPGANAEALRNFIAAHGQESLLFTIERGGEEMVFLARPQEGILEGRPAVGIELDDYGVLKLPPHLALLEGASLTARTTLLVGAGILGFLGSVVTGTADFSSVAGPIGIVSFGASAVGQGVLTTLLVTALISINLAIINLLPVPGLDGGRLFILAVEAVLRRTLSERVTTALTVAGFGLIVLLIITVSFHDITRLVS